MLCFTFYPSGGPEGFLDFRLFLIFFIGPAALAAVGPVFLCLVFFIRPAW
jgi:hypothetical protein